MLRVPVNGGQVRQAASWPEFRFDLAALSTPLAEARREQGILLGKAQAIGIEAIQSAISDIWTDEALATASIEGEKLNLDAVRSSVARRLGLATASAGPVARNVEGLLDVMADATDRADQPLTAQRLCAWQAALFPTGRSGLHEIVVGAFRTRSDPMQVVSGGAGRERVHYVAPPSASVAEAMDRFLQWFEKTRAGSTDGVVRAAIAHLWFETVHPFEDGNGRVGRAIVDLVLAQDSGMPSRLYRLSRQFEIHRGEYYDELEKAQKGDLEITGWVSWFIFQFHQACREAGEVIERSLQKARFWSSHTGVELNARQRKIINALLNAGPGAFEGGMSTRKYANLAPASRATASRELIDLKSKGLLVSVGIGKATKYYVAVPGWPASHEMKGDSGRHGARRG